MREESNGKQCRVVKNKNFTTMSNIHLRAKYLSLKAKGLMSLCLSLPENWDYSIAGLVTLSSDGRDGVTNTLNELKKFGFLTVEKKRTIKGAFTTFYTFYENPEENPNFNVEPITENPTRVENRNGFPVTANPIQLCRNGSTETANPEQINTNNEILKTNTNNQLVLIKTEESVFTSKDLFNLYKTICVHFPQPRELTDSRKTKAEKRLKENGTKEFWEVVFKNAEKSLFIRKKGSFFCFDWVLENDKNALKVFEGNYNKEEIKEESNFESGNDSSKGKYSKCYG